MDAGARDTRVEWREWGQAAFVEAAASNRPILLALRTEWAEECHVMDRSTYAEPRIAANLNEYFVPVRVDADRHPRVRDRYNMGGFPSTVFLTPDGEILTGATLLGVEGFSDILDRVRETWEERGAEAGSVPRALAGGLPPDGALDARVEEHMVEQLLGTYDEEFGGWGSDHKFPLPHTIEFALVRAPDQATRTLDAIETHLRDSDDGGFYRFARNRNWTGTRREKLLDENAALLRAFAHGYRYTGEETYCEVAEETLEYLAGTLWTGAGFGASQGGNGGYFTLEPADREAADPPPVDEIVLAGHNGLAIDACCTLHSYTDDERAKRYAERTLEAVADALVTDGRVRRSADDDAPSGCLTDQARVLAGLTTAWQVFDEPGPARAIADWTIDHLRTEAGAFLDGPSTAPGLLSEPLYPLDATAALADALLDLALLSGEERYRAVAHDAIAAFAGASERMGVEVAHYATVAARLREPSVVQVGTLAGSDLHRAALRLADHESVVVPAVGRHERTVAAPDLGEAARLVVDGEEQGRAASPADLEAVLTSGGSPRQ